MNNTRSDQEIEFSMDNTKLVDDTMPNSVESKLLFERTKHDRRSRSKSSTFTPKRYRRRNASSSSSSSSTSTSTSSSSSVSGKRRKPYFSDPKREKERIMRDRQHKEKTRRAVRRRERYEKYRRECSRKSFQAGTHHYASTDNNQRKSKFRQSPSVEKQKQPQIIILPIQQSSYPPHALSFMPPQRTASIQMPYVSTPNGFQQIPQMIPMPPYFGVPMRMPPMMIRHRPLNMPLPNRMPPHMARRFRYSGPFHWKQMQ